MSAKPSSTGMDLQPQLPMWPRDVRGLPNAFARSALFGVANIRKGARGHLKRHPVAALKGITIQYTGEELRQDDEDVFLQILHLARTQALGESVRFSAYSMLTELGWTRNTGSYKRLADSLDRMKASAVAVTVECASGARENYTGSLIRAFRWRESSTDAPLRMWEILLEPEIVALFNPQSYTRLDWSLRMKLPPLAKWLHTFYHSHETPFPCKVETLHRLTASDAAKLFQFRYKLRKALDLLVERGFLLSANIDLQSDLVTVERSRNRLTLA